jgi:nitrite reductase/ring-hydroxylating ferredoxin subunit
MTQKFDQGARGWHKASFSADSGECVEVGEFPTGDVAVRDTKAAKSGPVLGFSADAWSAFVADVKDGRFAV